MNSKANGTRIEEIIINAYSLQEDHIGFDALMGKHPIEIKGCLMLHSNGVGVRGENRVTKGRFWIDNRNHRLLLKEDGFYIFAVYREIEEAIIIIKSKMLSASTLDRYIGDGDNTKISYTWMFPELYRMDEL